ncbi:MAG: hypothetical protein IID45_08250 [Planctomycetes bacterium]|nr:hypothetical protein [Planctomycetota bacterium]
MNAVIAGVKANRGKVVVNTVAMGPSHRTTHRKFLRDPVDAAGLGSVQLPVYGIN